MDTNEPGAEFDNDEELQRVLAMSMEENLTEEEMINVAIALSFDGDQTTIEDLEYNNQNSTQGMMEESYDDNQSFHSTQDKYSNETADNNNTKDLSNDDMDIPHPFITTDKDNKLKLNSAIFSYLYAIEEPIVVVSVAGLYRTGKSYLLNRLAGKQSGFPLGSTVQSETKGIWIWLTKHPVQTDKVLVLLDTEGLADPEKGDVTHDVWIFCLAILLSSTFVYNSKGVIDSNALQDLQLTTELTSHIKLKATGNDSQELDEAFPSFIWAVRDFFLKPEVDGKKVTPDEYLEWNLQLKKGRGNSVVQANNIRRSIRDNFKERKCFLFPFPTSADKLQVLETIPYEELHPEFVDTTEKFTNFIFENSIPKLIKGKPLNGRMFLTLAKSYVEAISRGAVPVIETAVDYLAQVENEKAKDEALLLFRNWCTSLTLPIPSLALNSQISFNQKGSIKLFSIHCIFDDDQKHSADLAFKLANISEELIEKNLDQSKNKCKEILSNSFTDLVEKSKNGYYIRVNGYEEYQIDFLDAMEVYNSSVEELEGGSEVLSKFQSETEGLRSQIISADNQLDEEEKKTQLLQLEKEEEERKGRQALEKIEQLRHQGEEAKRNYQEGLQLYKKEMEEKMKSERDKASERLQNSLHEQQELMKQGFQEEAQKLRANLQKRVDNLQAKEREENAKFKQFEQRMKYEMEARNRTHQKELNRLHAKANRPPPRSKDNCVLS